MNGKAMMDGASRRLRRIRQIVQQVEKRLGKAAIDFAAVQSGINEVKQSSGILAELEQELRNAETLAMPDNWRILVIYDEPFATYYLDNVELNVLRMGLQNCKVDRLEVIWEFVSDELTRKGRPKKWSSQQ